MDPSGPASPLSAEIVNALQDEASTDELADLLRAYGGGLLQEPSRVHASALAMLVSHHLAPFRPALELAALNLYDAEEYIMATVVCVRPLQCVQNRNYELCLVSASSLFRLGVHAFSETI